MADKPQHEMQHPESPTWCIHCGTFDVFCAGIACTEDRSGQFDNRKHSLKEVLGIEGQ